MLVVRQNWLPGWYAYLDDKEHPVAQVQAYMIGVFAPKGKHTLILEYRTPGFWIGLGFSIMGVLGVGAVWYRLFIGREEREEDLLVHSAVR